MEIDTGNSGREAAPQRRDIAVETLHADQFRHIVWWGLGVLLVFFGGLGLWAGLAKLSSAVMAQGLVKVDLNRKAVQHREGGIVQDILVREGDLVRAGQPLLLLTDSNVEASAAVTGGQLAQMLARQARLDAQRQLKTNVDWPQELSARRDAPEIRQLLDGEENILREERQTLEGQIRLLQQQVLGMQAQVQAEERIIAAYQEELVAKQELQRGRYLEKTPVLDLQRNLAQHQSLKSVTQQKIAETGLRVSEMRKEYAQRATTQYAEVQARVVELRERLRPSQDAKERLSITAPVAGVVMDLTVFTKGAVLRPGERVLDIVPQGGPLIVEADVQVKDIAKVRVGQAAKIQISAYTQAEAPPLSGQVTYVSPDRTLSRGAHGDVPVYKIQAAIEAGELERNRLSLTAGMPATVYVLTKEKSVLGYLLEPIVERLNQAMRE